MHNFMHRVMFGFLIPPFPLKLKPSVIYICNLLFCGLLITSLYTLIVNNYIIPTGNQQYLELTRSFIKGRTYFTSDPSFDYPYADCSFFNGRYYWPLGVLPAILMVPFVLISGDSFTQGMLSGTLTLLNLVVLFIISYRIIQDREKSLYLASGYVFASAYFFVGLQPLSWYLAHVLATSGLLGAIYFTLIRRSPFLSGLLFTCAFLSRISVVFGGLFFVYYLVNSKYRGIRKDIVTFLAPVVFGLLFFSIYNYIRFGSPEETGYRYQLLFTELVGNRGNGMWSLAHFPANIYYMLLKGPDASFQEGTKILTGLYPDIWGMGVLYTTPIFLYLLFMNTRDKIVKASLLGAIPVLVFLLGSFGIGAYQYGYRFVLDFQPFLYLILISVFVKRRLGIFARLVVIGSFIFNIYMSNHFIINITSIYPR